MTELWLMAQPVHKWKGSLNHILTKVIYTTFPTTYGTKCEKMRADVLNSGIVGAWVPTCDERGNFTRKQCNNSARTCWCVSRLTGEMVEDTHQVRQVSDYVSLSLLTFQKYRQF